MAQTDTFDGTVFKISIKMRYFYVTIGIKIPCFRVLVTIEPGHSLLQFITTNCFIMRGKGINRQSSNYNVYIGLWDKVRNLMVLLLLL